MMNLLSKRTVFFVSDGTGITAETLGHSLLTQFDSIQFEHITYPYITTTAKAREVVAHINQVARQAAHKPLVFSTLVSAEIRAQFVECQGLLLDFFDKFIGPLEQELGQQSAHQVGRSHGVLNYESYKARIEAVNYALINDDGANIHNFAVADLILIGVSRCGKTPTSLYLALQFGVRVANYPFTPDDGMALSLPKFLLPYRAKLFGLTIDPLRLQQIRSERRPNSQYAALAQCRKEVEQVEALYHKENLPFLNTTVHSIEEIATKILAKTGVKRQLL